MRSKTEITKNIAKLVNAPGRKGEATKIICFIEKPKREELIKFMVEEHDFSYERVKKTLDSLEKVFVSGRQSSLSSWFNK